ncbi:MAG: phosphoenolpyruvate--protein phosphotransferase [Planctomycetota bacterium]
MWTVEGVGVSPGIVIGRAYVMDEAALRVQRRKIAPQEVEQELKRLQDAIEASAEELRAVRDEAERVMGAEAAKVFGFHAALLQDRALMDPIRALIADRLDAAEYAAFKQFQLLAERFRSMPDSAFTTKTDDIDDLLERLLTNLGLTRPTVVDDMPPNAVVIARDLTPSETIRFDRKRVVALVTDLGGKTSHTAIVARALGLPAVVATGSASESADDDLAVIVDGARGLIIFEPDEETLERYQTKVETQETYRLSLNELRDLPAVTTDDQTVELLGNIEFPDEAPSVVANGAAGVGLYRTEFLYLERDDPPTEEEHFEAYSECVRGLNGLPLVIRTLDLGADKYGTEEREGRRPIRERNPFLGLRSIRYTLRRPELFRPQLRAILRASALGDVRVMFPLVTSVHEFRHARMLLGDIMEDLSEEGIPFNREIKVGMMVETPASAIMAEVFAREADFLSIGTNDLVQYTLAVDRTNERVNDLFQPTHPAVIRMVRETVRGARRHGTPVSCCGEAAAEPEMALLLVGLGVRTLSVSASSAPQLKRLIRSVEMGACERLAKKAISFDSEAEVSAFLRSRVRKIVPEAASGRPDEE